MSGSITLDRKTKLVNAVRRLQAYEVIQNNMGRCVAAFNFRQPDKVLSYFALSRPDVSLEYADEGVFEGPQVVRQVVHELLGAPAKPGEMLDMQINTPMIEVAGDLETARALWWAPGAGAIPGADGLPQAIWCWGMLAADFIHESDTDTWAIWHLHWFRFIKCSYEKGWVEDTSLINRLNTPVHPLAKPSTYHNPYSPLSIRDGIPACPRPYETWSDSNWVLERDKSK